MPGSSAMSVHSSSSSSKRGKTRSYYKVAANSQVDESLFGAPNRDQQRAKMLEEKWRDPASPLEAEAAERQAKRSGGKTRKPKRETVQVITKDLIRNLIVPQDDPSGQSMVLSRGDFERIRGSARVLTQAELRAKMEDLKLAKEQLMDDVQQRKEFMKMKDVQRKKNEKLNELEEEERVKAEHLREAANEKLQEQEDEIKHLNELILNAKCHAIRDTQILEKDMIKGEMQHEEQRLDTMMEVDRINSIKVEEEIEKKKKTERLLGAMKIMEQIQENEQERLLELERKDQENRVMQVYLDKLCEEEADKLERKRDEQTNLREELNQCNEDIIKRKELSKEQEKMLEAKVIKYQKSKAEREQAYEREQEAIRIEKEKEVARLRAQQERARDEQAERDALRAKRAQEQAEREWRKKEATEQIKKAQTEAMLKVARTQQMEQKEHFLAVEAQRERAEFERVLRAQQELIVKEKGEENSRKAGLSQYADEVRAQIKEKEQIRVSERNAFFEEGIKLDEEARQRRLRLEDIKRKKLNELKAAGIHDKYLTQIERKINQPQGLAT